MNIKKKKITDIDAVELSGAWVYRDNITTGDKPIVNGKKYKVIESPETGSSGLDYKVFEQYDGKQPTGEVALVYQGTNLKDVKGDVYTDLLLPGKKNPTQMEDARKVYTDLKNKYADANVLSAREFKKLMNKLNISVMASMTFRHKWLT